MLRSWYLVIWKKKSIEPDRWMKDAEAIRSDNTNACIVCNFFYFPLNNLSTFCFAKSGGRYDYMMNSFNRMLPQK